MEYKLKITLMDDTGKTLVSTNLSEKYLDDMKEFHPEVNIVSEILKVMKIQHETGSPVEPLPEPKKPLTGDEIRELFTAIGPPPRDIALASGTSVLTYLMQILKMRKFRLDDGTIPWIEDGVRVCREDVQDYTAFTGVDGDEAYKRLKAFYLGETDTL